MNNSNESKIGPYFVDGFDADTKTIYEYHGYYYHGCICMKYMKESDRNEKFKRTQLRKSYLQNLGYTVIEKWECEFISDSKKNSKLKQFIEKSLSKFANSHNHT